MAALTKNVWNKTYGYLFLNNHIEISVTFFKNKFFKITKIETGGNAPKNVLNISFFR